MVTTYFTIFPDDQIVPVCTASGVVMGRRGGVDCEWCGNGEKGKVKEMGCLDCSVLSENTCMQLEGL